MAVRASAGGSPSGDALRRLKLTHFHVRFSQPEITAKPCIGPHYDDMKRPRSKPVTPDDAYRWLPLLWALALLAAAIAISLVGAGLAAVVSDAGTPTDWHEVSEAFEVVNAVFSVLALIVVAATLWIQHRELRMQRTELTMQRQTLDRSHMELKRSAEASLRALHVDLIKLAIEDEVLAGVWPDNYPGITSDRKRQHLYANLAIEHLHYALRLHSRPIEQVREALRLNFSSPVIREFWDSARVIYLRGARPLDDFYVVCDEVYREVSSPAGS
jgi:hypothetical protein